MSSRANPKRDWYVWADPKSGDPGSTPPNNWRSVTEQEKEGSAWVLDERTGQYYLASFSPAQPDLNWANSEVRAAMLGAMRFWLERGADGFRVDMLDFIGKDEALRDEPSAPETGAIEASEEAGAADYLSAARYHVNRPETYGYIREMRRLVDEYPDRVLIGELNYSTPLERLLTY